MRPSSAVVRTAIARLKTHSTRNARYVQHSPSCATAGFHGRTATYFQTRIAPEDENDRDLQLPELPLQR